MPVTTAKLKAKSSEISIDLGDGDSLKVTYNPNNITTNTETGRKAREKAGEFFVSVLTDMMPSIITDWDYLDDETKKPMPITKEVLDGMGVNLVVGIWNAMMADTSPGK